MIKLVLIRVGDADQLGADQRRLRLISSVLIRGGGDQRWGC